MIQSEILQTFSDSFFFLGGEMGLVRYFNPGFKQATWVFKQPNWTQDLIRAGPVVGGPREDALLRHHSTSTVMWLFALSLYSAVFAEMTHTRPIVRTRWK